MAKYLILLIAIFSLATAPILVKLLQISPLLGIFWRMIFVIIFLSPFAFKYRVPVSFSQIKRIFITSVIFTIHFLAWFEGVPQLPIGITVIIFALNPIFTAVLSFIFLKEEFQPKHLLGILLSIAGIVIVFYTQANLDVSFWACLQILLAAFFFSAYVVSSKYQRISLPNSIFTFYLNIGVLLFISTLVLSMYASANLDFSLLDVKNHQWIYLILLALVPSVLGHTLMVYSLPKFNLNFLSCMKLLSPLIAILMGALIFKEELTLNYLVGFLFVMTGVLVTVPKRS